MSTFMKLIRTMWFWCLLLVCVTSTYSLQDQNVTSRVRVVRQTPSVLNFGGKSYHFFVVLRVNYFQATQFCNNQGLRLVSITSKDVNDRLGKFAEEIGQGRKNFWTSGTNLQVTDYAEWIWLSIGVAFSYTNWYPGEPNNHGSKNVPGPEQCVEARTVDNKGFTWNDLSCNVKIYFICESYTCKN